VQDIIDSVVSNLPRELRQRSGQPRKKCALEQRFRNCLPKAGAKQLSREKGRDWTVLISTV
jgi:hypothetical protein